MFSCLNPMALSRSRQAIPAAPAPLTHKRGRFRLAACQFQRIENTGSRNDRGAMLVIMEDRNIEQLLEALLDDEALRRLDIFKIDAAKALAEIAHAIDEFVRIFRVHFQIEGIDIRKALEQHRLALHHRLGGQCAEIAKSQNGRAIGDDGDHIALAS